MVDSRFIVWNSLDFFSPKYIWSAVVDMEGRLYILTLAAGWDQPRNSTVVEISVRLEGTQFWTPQSTACTCLCSATSCVWLFAIPWIIALEAPLSMGFSRQEYWGGLPFLPPGELPNQGLTLCLLHWQADSLPLSHLGSPFSKYWLLIKSARTRLMC